MSVVEGPTSILPDRVTTPTCVACGAMGRAARCEGDCSEHRLPLVGAADLDALRAAGRAARARLGCQALATILGRVATVKPKPGVCVETWRALQSQARISAGS